MPDFKNSLSELSAPLFIELTPFAILPQLLIALLHLLHLYEFRSNVDVLTNRRILSLFFILVTLAVVSAVGAHFYEESLFDVAYYLGLSGTSFVFAFPFVCFIKFDSCTPTIKVSIATR